MASRKVPKFDALDHALVIRMYVEEQKSMRAIAEELGVSRYLITKVLKTYDVPRRSLSEAFRLRQYTGMHTDAKLKAAVIRLYCDEKLSLAGCGKRLGISGVHIGNLMHRWGIPRRKANGRQPKWAVLDADAIVRLYVEEFLTLPEIASKYNVSPPTIAKVLERQGVPRRTISEAKALCHKRREQKQASLTTPDTFEQVDPSDASIEDRILSMRHHQNAKIQDIAHSLCIPTVRVYEVLQGAGLMG